MSEHTNGQFVICGGSDQYWLGTTAKTLNGAKAIASKTYQAAVGSKIEVAICRVNTERCEAVAVEGGVIPAETYVNRDYQVVAVKYGHDAWQNA